MVLEHILDCSNHTMNNNRLMTVSLHKRLAALTGWLPRMLLVCVLLAPAGRVAAEDWPTTEFEVVLGPPIARHWGDGELADYMDQILPLFNLPLLSEKLELVDQIEAALSDVAKHYEAMGFPEPLLEPLVTRDDGSLAYRVFVCKQSWLDKLEDDLAELRYNDKEARSNPVVVNIPFLPTLRSIWERCGSENAAAHLGRCGDTAGFRNYIYINRERRFDHGNMDFWDYEVLAHELFHAVQAGSVWGDHSSPCDTGSWIKEGMADAIAGDYVRDHIEGVYDLTPNRSKEYGIRNYAIPLSTRLAQWVYETSSFWRHVAEWYHAAIANAGRRVGSAKTKTNYGYLVHLLKQPMAGAKGSRRELRWLDEGLRSTPRLTTNLARVYAEFIASFADQQRTRIATEKERDSKAALDRFLRFVFGGSTQPGSTGNPCKKIHLSPDEPVQAQYFLLNEVAANCFELTVHSVYGPSIPQQVYGPVKPVVVTMSTGLSPRDELTPLWVGKSGGMEVSQFLLFRPENNTVAPVFGTAQFRVNTGEPTRFAIANVAHYAQNSKLLTPTITFTLDGWDSSLTKPPPARKAPVRPKAGQRPDDARGKHEAELDEQFEEGLGRLTPNGLGSTEIQRNEADFGRCAGERKRYNLCGPQLEITLELVSEAAALVAASTTGGFFNQMRAGGVGRFQEMSIAELQALKDMDDEMSPKFIEGGRISIAVPLVDYGFNGSFSNAMLTVSKEGGGIYSATSSRAVAVGGGGLGGPTRRHVPTGQVTIEEYTPFILRGTFEGSLIERRNDRPYEPDEVIPIVNRVSGRFSIGNPFDHDSEYRADEEFFRQQMGLDVLDNPTMSGDGPVQPSEAFSPDDIRELCEMGIDDHLPRAELCQTECAAEYQQCALNSGDPQMQALLELLNNSAFPEELKQQYIAEFPGMNQEDRQMLLELIELTNQFGPGN